MKQIMWAYALIFLCVCLAACRHRELRLDGRVLGPEGQPVSGALVAVLPANTMAVHDACAQVKLVRTDSGGRFQILLPAGQFALSVSHQDFAGAFLPKVTVPDTKSEPVELRLQPGIPVRGRLVTRQGEHPDGLVALSPQEGSDLSEVKFLVAETHGGAFQFAVTPGNYELLVSSDLYAGFCESVEVPSSGLNYDPLLLPKASPAPEAVKQWLRAQAVPLKTALPGQGFRDMEPIRAMVGQARIVALGEATHGSREFFLLKHRMLEFLVEEMGFTAFALEANMPEARQVDDYVLTGKGDPATALAELYCWSWDTDEVLDLIRWMRAYNEDPRHVRKLRFYGFDMQYPREAFVEARAYLRRVDPPSAIRLAQDLEDLGYRELDPKPDLATTREWRQGAEGILTRLLARKRKLVAQDGQVVFERQCQNLRLLAQYAGMKGASDGMFSGRDRAMAENVQWLLRQEGDQGKVVLWAHNGHVAAARWGAVDPMGWHLRKALGKDMVVFGFAFHQGAFSDRTVWGGKIEACAVKPNQKGTLDNALASAGYPLAVWDLRTLPAEGEVGQWFHSPQGAWSIGALFIPDKPDRLIGSRVCPDMFDAVIFVETTTAARNRGR